MNGRFERNPGRIVDLRFGESQDVLDLQWKDQVGHVICVTLIGPPANDGSQNLAAVVTAFVQWGAGEAEAEAEIDFGVGGSVFTLPASSIRIKAKYEDGGAGSESTPPVRVGAFASVGSGGRTSRLTRTRFNNSEILVGDTVDFVVPPFAKAVRVLGGDQAARAMRLDFQSDVGLPPVYSVQVAPGAEAPSVDLSPDITFVQMTNTGATSLEMGVRAVFELGI